MRDQFRLLSDLRFYPLFWVQFLGAFNDNAFKSGIIVLATYGAVSANLPFHGPNAEAILGALASAMLILPMVIFSSIAGDFAEKYDKAKLTRIFKFAEIVLMAFAVVAFYFEWLYFLLLVLFFMGLQSTFFGPIKYGYLPDVLEKKELINANALMELGTFLSILLGVLVGTIIVSIQAGMYYLCILILSVAIVGYLISKKIPSVTSNRKIGVSWNIYQGITTNWRKVKRVRPVYLSIFAISWFWCIGAIYLSAVPSFTKNYLLGDEAVNALLLAVFSIGIGIGSLLCDRLLRGNIEAVFVPLAALGISLFTFDLYLASPYVTVEPHSLMGVGDFLSSFNNCRVLFDLLMVSICGGVFVVPLFAIVQDRSPKGYKSRIIAMNNIVNAVIMVAGLLVMMWLSAIGFSLPTILLFVAIANLFVVVKLCQLLPGAMIRSIIRSILTFMFDVKVVGIENFHKAGKRAVITPNHPSYADGILMAAFMPGEMIFSIYSEFIDKWWFKPVKLFVKAYPLATTNPFSLRGLIRQVKQDNKCIIFPEGRISHTGALMKIYEGPGVIADKANAKILPVRIDGAEYSIFSRLKRVARWKLFPKITITILPPEEVNVDKEVFGRARRREIGERLYRIMTNMMYTSGKEPTGLYQSLLDARNIHGGFKEIINDITRMPWNYNKLIFRSQVLSEFVKGWAPKDKTIGLMLPNSIAVVATFYGLQAAEKVVAMINFSLGPKNILLSCQTSKVKRVLTSKLFIEKARLEKVVETLEQNGIEVFYLERVKEKPLIKEKITAVAKTIYLFARNRTWHEADPHKPALILFTSGSEGPPKAVVLSAYNLLMNHNQMSAVVDFNPGDRVLNAMPVFHSVGMNIGMLLPVTHGLPVFMYPSPLHYRIVPELVYDTSATIFFGTNTFLNGYGRFAHAYDFFSVRYVFAGAERLGEDTKEMWMTKFGIRILEAYGTTETSPVISANTSMHYKPGSVGCPLPGTELKFEDVPGIDEGGRMYVSGPNVMLGYYYHDKPGVLVKPEDGWHDTGDIVLQDEDGYLFIQGRVKRFAKIAGEMIPLTTVEQLVDSLWPDINHAIVAVKDFKKGEKLVLITEHQEAAIKELRSHIQQLGYSDLYVPRELLVVDRVPVLGTGKTNYPECAELAAQFEQAAPPNIS